MRKLVGFLFFFPSFLFAQAQITAGDQLILDGISNLSFNQATLSSNQISLLLNQSQDTAMIMDRLYALRLDVENRYADLSSDMLNLENMISSLSLSGGGGSGSGDASCGSFSNPCYVTDFDTAMAVYDVVTSIYELQDQLSSEFNSLNIMLEYQKQYLTKIQEDMHTSSLILDMVHDDTSELRKRCPVQNFRPNITAPYSVIQDTWQGSTDPAWRSIPCQLELNAAYSMQIDYKMGQLIEAINALKASQVVSSSDQEANRVQLASYNSGLNTAANSSSQISSSAGETSIADAKTKVTESMSSLNSVIERQRIFSDSAGGSCTLRVSFSPFVNYTAEFSNDFPLFRQALRLAMQFIEGITFLLFFWRNAKEFMNVDLRDLRLMLEQALYQTVA